MTILIKAIRTLLYEHDYVTIPNLGAFIAHYLPAEYRSENKSFSPPLRKVSFNALLKQDDGLLTTYVAKKQGVSREEARNGIDNFVATLKQEIHNKGIFQLDGVGFFTLSEEKKLVFEPYSAANFNPESFGLDSFYTTRNFSRSSLDLIASEAPKPMDFIELELPSPKPVTSTFKRVLYGMPVALLSFGLTYLMLLSPSSPKEAVSSVNPLEHIASFKQSIELAKAESQQIAQNSDDSDSWSNTDATRVAVQSAKSRENLTKLHNKLVLLGLDPSIEQKSEGFQLTVEKEQLIKGKNQKYVEQLIGRRIVLP